MLFRPADEAALRPKGLRRYAARFFVALRATQNDINLKGITLFSP